MTLIPTGVVGGVPAHWPRRAFIERVKKEHRLVPVMWKNVCEVWFCEFADGLMDSSGSRVSTDGHSESRWTSEASARQMGQVRFACRRRRSRTGLKIKHLTRTNTPFHLVANEWQGHNKLHILKCS